MKPVPYTQDELEAAVAEFPFWYHKIDLGQGVVTPGRDYEDMWALIREVRDTLDYSEKYVLDLASFDGLWAFEAEQLGAGTGIATDVVAASFRNFLFCKSVLGSDVIPYYNVSPYKLVERLDVPSLEADPGKRKLFDIVQHLGLLYHLRDPMMSLSQSRSMLRRGGLMLLETGAFLDNDRSAMLFNISRGRGPRIYEDPTTWWLPTILCVKEMLNASLFRVREETVRILPWGKHGRLCLVAEAIGPDEVRPELADLLFRTYLNPGLSTDDL
jgi:tRNA (mo5U34)-methyltransferase